MIDNVLNNSKEMLKMLINMTGYITSTISMCQEVAASNTTVRLSSASDGSKGYLITLLLNLKDFAT